MKKSRRLAIVSLLFVPVLIASACGGDDDEDGTAGGEDGEACTWIIGTMGALSGDFATIGQPIFQGIQFAVNELNDEGDLACTLELQEEDSQGSPDQAPALAQSLVENEELVAVVGPYFSGETLATGEIFSSASIPFMTPSATNETIDDQGYTTFFRGVADDATQGEVAGQYIESLDPSSVAIVHDNQDYSKGLADRVKEALPDAEGPFIINPEETDYSAVVQQVRDANPDVVFYGGFSPQAGPLVQQLREAGVEAQFISSDGTKDSAFGDLAGDAARGVQVTCPCVDPLQRPEAQDFVEGINEEFDRNPGTFAADAYDAVNLVAEGLKEAEGGGAIEGVRQVVLEYLQNVEEYEGITKTYTFGETGNVEVGPEAIYVYEWSDEDEDFVSLGPASDLI